MPNPYEAPSIDINSLERVVDGDIDEWVVTGKDMQAIRDQKAAELEILEQVVNPTTETQRLMFVKRTIIRCINRRFAFMQ